MLANARAVPLFPPRQGGTSYEYGTKVRTARCVSLVLYVRGHYFQRFVESIGDGLLTTTKYMRSRKRKAIVEGSESG